MFHSKGMYIILGIFVFTAILTIGMLKFSQVNPELFKPTSEMDEKLEASLDDMHVGISISSTDFNTEDLSVEALFKSFTSSGFLLLFAGIFIAIFTCSESGTGFIKNVVTKKSYRSQMVLSKTVSASLFLIIEFIVLIILSAIASFALFDGIGIVNPTAYFSYLGLQFLLHLAVITLINAVCIISRNMAFSISGSILISVNLLSLIYVLLDKLNLGFSFIKLSLVTGIMTLPSSYDSSIYPILIIVSIVSIIIYHAASIFVSQRQDVK